MIASDAHLRALPERPRPGRLLPARIILFALLFPSLPCGGAEPMTVGKVTFNPPDGWTVADQGDGVVKAVSPDQNSLILVFVSEAKVEAELADAYRVTRQTVMEALRLRMVKDADPQTQRTKAGYDSLGASAKVQDGNGNAMVFRCTVLRHGGHTCALGYLVAEKLAEKYDPVYATVADSITLGGVAAAPPAPKPQPGVFAGRITDERGNLIEDAKVIVQINDVLVGGLHEVGPDGIYSVRVGDQRLGAQAWVEKKYNGGVAKLWLHPEDERSSSVLLDTRDGVVKNFVWKLTGKRLGQENQTEPSAYYGPCVRLKDAREPSDNARLGTRYPGGRIVLTLTPRDPLIDGSQGATLRLKTESELGGGRDFPDTPLGPYTATATLIAAEGREIPLLIAVTTTGVLDRRTDLRQSADVDFPPSEAPYGVKDVCLHLAE